MSGPRLLLLKTWVPPKKRKLRSGKVVDVKGYYDPRSPKRGYVKGDKWVHSVVDDQSSEIPISSASKIVDRSLPAKDMRKQAFSHAMSIRGEYKNHSVGWSVSVARSGIDKTLSHGVDPDHFDAISAIPDVILHGYIFRLDEPQKEKHKGSVDIFWYAVAPVKINGAVRIAKVVIRSNKDGYFYYDLDLSKKVEGSDISAPRKKRVAADNVEPSGDDSPHSLARKKRTDSSREPSVMSIQEIMKYVNADGGVMKKSMIVLCRTEAA